MTSLASHSFYVWNWVFSTIVHATVINARVLLTWIVISSIAMLSFSHYTHIPCNDKLILADRVCF